MKKLKIVVAGAGNAASKLIENMSKNSNHEVSYMIFSQELENKKFLDDEKVKAINTTRSTIISLEKAKEYAIRHDKTKELEELLLLMKDTNGLYEVYPLDSGDIQPMNWTDIKLKRGSETIGSFELYGDKNRI